MFYDEIRSDKFLKAHVTKAISSQETYHFLSRLLSRPPQIVVVIDQKTDEVTEACQVLRIQPSIVEFKTYVREDDENVRAHLFEPLSEPESPREEVKEKEEKKKKRPPHRLDWDKRLEWMNPSTRALVNQLTERIERDLADVTHSPHFRWYDFFKGNEKIRESRFAVLLITKKTVKVRMRTDPETFQDERSWTKPYEGWFFKKRGEERGFQITDADQIDYAMKLITQSYELAK